MATQERYQNSVLRERWDLVTGYTAWDAAGSVTTQRALTTAESQRLAAEDVALTADANKATLRAQAGNALTGNRAYSNLPTPTAAQTTAEVKALAQQMNGLIRLVLDQLDDTT